MNADSILTSNGWVFSEKRRLDGLTATKQEPGRRHYYHDEFPGHEIQVEGSTFHHNPPFIQTGYRNAVAGTGVVAGKGQVTELAAYLERLKNPSRRKFFMDT